MKCQSCGKEIDESLFSPDLTYCPYCGQELESVRLQFCPYCSQKLAAQTNFCPHCGKNLSFAETKPAGDEHTGKEFLEVTSKTIEKKAKTIAWSIRNAFGRERKIRKLYQQWAEYSELPPEEVPSIENLKRMSAEEKDRQHKPADDSEEE